MAVPYQVGKWIHEGGGAAGMKPWGKGTRSQRGIMVRSGRPGRDRLAEDRHQIGMEPGFYPSLTCRGGFDIRA